MSYGLKDQDILAVQGVLKKHPNVVTVILYGSRAKGNYRVASDIDLTLYGDRSITQNWRSLKMNRMTCYYPIHLICLFIIRSIMLTWLNILNVSVCCFMKNSREA